MTACGKNSPHNSVVVPDIIQAANKRGNITGMILLYDNEGVAVTDNSGVTVSIDNNNVSAKTDATGRWTLDSIPYGVYDLSFTKEGYATGKLMGVDHKANNHATTVITHSRPLNQISALEITALQISNFDANPTLASLIQAGIAANGVHIQPVFANPSGKNKPVRFFFSDNADVSSSNYAVTEIGRYSGIINQTDNSNFTLSWFVGKGFKAGQTIYVKAYGDGFAQDDYEDPISGSSVFPSLSAKSANASFVLPLK